MLIAKILTAQAGWLFKEFDEIETRYVDAKEVVGSANDHAGMPTDEPERGVMWTNRVETFATKEANHMPMFCVLYGRNKGEVGQEVIAFDTEGYILNSEGKTIERL